MRLVRTAIIAAVASTALAGAALAAHDESKMMLVAMPDGSVEHIRYESETVPQVMVVRAPAPVSIYEAAFGPSSPFAEMEHISAMMEAQAATLMRQAATLQAQPPAAGDGGIALTNSAGQPVGVMHYSYVSSTTSADGCTQTVRISSNGEDRQPRVIRTSAGDCSATGTAPAIAPAPRAAHPVTPAKAAPTAKHRSKVTPVNAQKPLPEFTPSYTI